MPVTGPTFIALQVRDVERAAEFYETRLRLKRTPVAPPGAVVLDTKPASFALRAARRPEVISDLDQGARLLECARRGDRMCRLGRARTKSVAG